MPPIQPSIVGPADLAPPTKGVEAAILAALGSRFLSARSIACHAGLSCGPRLDAALGNLYKLGLLARTSDGRWARTSALAREATEAAGPAAGGKLRGVRRELRAIRKLLRLLVEQRPACPSPPSTSAAAPDLSVCRRDILRVLQEEKRKLTVPALVEQLRRRGLDWREEVVQEQVLGLIQAGMVRDRSADGSATADVGSGAGLSP